MPPVVVAAGIGAAGAIGGAVLSSSAQKKAANKANDAQQQATDSQLQLGRESMALNRDIYNSNYGLLSPFVSNGLAASNSLNSLLGLPSGPALTSPLAGAPSAPAPVTSGVPSGYSPAIGGPAPAGIMPRTMNALGPMNAPPASLINNQNETAGTGHPARDRINESRAERGLPPLGATPSATATGTATGSPANSAFENFANSAGMQFQLKEGTNALNNLYAGRGMLQSGAAMKGINNYAQQTALNNYFMPYMGMLQGQQNMGAQSGAAIAGVGANFGNTAANINAGMGANIQNGADAAANAAIARGQANANMWSGIGSSLGTLAGGFFPR